MKTCMLRPDGRPDQMVLPGLDAPQLYTESEATQRRRSLLARFDAAPKTETAMWLAFRTLTWNDVAFLMAAFGLVDDWALFRRLCREYGVREA